MSWWPFGERFWYYFAAFGPRGEVQATYGAVKLGPGDAAVVRVDFQEEHWASRVVAWRWDGQRWVAA